MFRRIQQLRISLAAKCQLLFGAAVLLIIAAALFVPWHRIEQLTEQLNERTAESLAEHTVADHVAGYTYRGRSGPDMVGVTSTQPATRPARRPGGIGRGGFSAQLRLAVIGPRRENSDLARFEVRANSHFLRDDESPFYSAYYNRPDGTSGYRYAQPLRFTQACAGCHRPVAAAAAVSAMTRPASRPTTGRASGSAFARLAALPGAQVPIPVEPIPAVAGDPQAAPAGADDAPPPLAGVVSVEFPSRIDANQLLLNRAFILGALLLASFLAIVTFYYITTRLILQPVRVLQETAEKVSKGDLNIRSDISTGDEFQQLSETFNTMLTNLKASADQLRALNKSLDLRLGQLAESNVALFESNRLKSEFLANVSHELRTPLNSILGFADLLKDAVAAAPAAHAAAPAAHAAGSEAKSTRYVTNILTSGRHLLELINDLLDLAKIEAGRMEVRSEPLSLSDTFEGLTNLLKPLLEQKRLTLAISVDPGIPILRTDPGKLQQVLYNFLSNAIKFSPAGATIDLKATVEQPGDPANPSPGGDADVPPATPRLPRPDRARPTTARDDEPHVRVSVADRGPGIAADQQNVIFEKFRQIDGSVTRAHSGTGLGLAISKELTLLMGGTIGVKSKVGEGATFWVVLPLNVAAGTKDVRARLVVA